PDLLNIPLQRRASDVSVLDVPLIVPNFLYTCFQSQSGLIECCLRLSLRSAASGHLLLKNLHHNQVGGASGLEENRQEGDFVVMKGKLLFWGLLLFGAAPVNALHAGQKNSDVDEIGRRDINKGSINFTSLEKEIALGRSMAAEVEKQVKLISDPEVTEYVSR